MSEFKMNKDIIADLTKQLDAVNCKLMERESYIKQTQIIRSDEYQRNQEFLSRAENAESEYENAKITIQDLNNKLDVMEIEREGDAEIIADLHTQLATVTSDCHVMSDQVLKLHPELTDYQVRDTARKYAEVKDVQNRT